MDKLIKKILQVIPIFFIILLSFFALNAGLNAKVSPRDSGVFLYIGQGLLKGEVPYLNFWDHKPPLVYFLNALALLIDNASLRGLWILEYFSLLVSLLVCFFILKKFLTKTFSWLGTIMVALFASSFFTGGNRVEEWALPVQFLILYIFSLKNLKTLKPKILFFIGNLTAILFLFRQNLIGVTLALIGYWLIEDFYHRQIKKFYLKMLWLGAGFIVPVLIVYFYFVSKKAGFDFFDQTLIYNLVYSQSPLSLKLRTSYEGLILLWPTWILAVFSMAFSVYGLIIKSKKVKKMVLLATFLFPIEVILSSISGKTYYHYYISWIPALSLLATNFYFLLFQALSKKRRKNFLPAILMTLFFFLIVNFNQGKSFILKNLDKNLAAYTLNLKPLVYRSNYVKYADTLQAISLYSKKSDTLLVWGSESALYFLSNRKAASRYFYQYPLFTKGYTHNNLVTDFVFEIIQAKPKIIVDASSSTLDKQIRTSAVIPPLDRQKRQKWFEENYYFSQFNSFENFFELVEKDYRLITLTQDKDWKIYVLKN